MSDDAADADEELAQAVLDAQLARWPEQYKRMLRWRTRLNEPVRDEERHRDDFYAFFVAAYHLADWIKNDVTVAEDVRQAVWKFRHTGALALAADVTNGFKHLKRNQEAEVDGAAHVSILGTFSVVVTLVSPVGAPGVGVPQAAVDYTVAVAGDRTRENAYDLARRCVREWDIFLRDHGLRTPPPEKP